MCVLGFKGCMYCMQSPFLPCCFPDQLAVSENEICALKSMEVFVHTRIYICVCVCVEDRQRERERKREAMPCNVKNLMTWTRKAARCQHFFTNRQ